jgi:hypothetical protein
VESCTRPEADDRYFLRSLLSVSYFPVAWFAV